MTRRRLTIDVLLLLVAICLGLLWFLSLPKHRFTAAMLDRIHLGMTEEEAQAILGTPEHLAYPDAPPISISPTERPSKARRVRMEWYSFDDLDGGRIIVDFDKAGRVQSARFSQIPLQDRIWRLIGPQR
jgi:hypothetical protein